MYYIIKSKNQLRHRLKMQFCLMLHTLLEPVNNLIKPNNKFVSGDGRNLSEHSFRLNEEEKTNRKIGHRQLCFPSLSSNWSKQPFRLKAGSIVNPALLPQHLSLILMSLRRHLAWGRGDQHPGRRSSSGSRRSRWWKLQHLQHNI